MGSPKIDEMKKIVTEMEHRFIEHLMDENEKLRNENFQLEKENKAAVCRRRILFGEL